MKVIFLAVQAFFAAFAMCNIGNISTADILSVILFGAAWLLLTYGKKQAKKEGTPAGYRSVCRCLAALYTLFYMAGSYQTITGGFDSHLFQLGFAAGTGVGLYLLFLAACYTGMSWFGRLALQKDVRPFSRKEKAMLFFGLLLCWSFWFLYNYPGVMTPDSLSQFAQATGQKALSSHHPPAHTLLIFLCYQLGYGISGNVYIGIACYTIFQMLVLAAVETACLSLLARAGAKRWMLYLGFAFWGLVPYHGIFAVTMWKDVLFSAFVLLYVLLLYLLLRRDSGRHIGGQDWKLLAGCLGAGALVCLMRSNGLYIFLFTLPFVLFTFRRSLKAMLPVQLLTLVLVLFVTGPVFDRLGVTKPAFTESLSIPLQQVARVVSEGRSLTKEQTELIDRVADSSLIPDYYNPVISDPIKALVNYNHPEVLSEQPADYAGLWLELGLSWPQDYVAAFIDQTRGYYFPAPASLRTNEGISPNELGLSWPHLLPGQIPVKISELLLKLPDILPLYGILWSIGAFFWAVLFLAGFQLLYGEKKYLLLYLPFIATILTLLIATPVASDLRYAYPLFLGMPFLMLLPVVTGKEKVAIDNHVNAV